LQQAAGNDTLSIKFKVDGINFDIKSPGFSCGRLVGTIGPYADKEPLHMILGRHFVAEGIQWPAPQAAIHYFRPVGQISHCTNRFYFDQFQTAPAPGRSFVFGVTLNLFRKLWG
jgi:hypothetical protein